MAYTINLTDGTIFAVVADGTVNTQSSMILVGKNYAGYGEFLDENFIHLLENGANSTPPGAPLTGQLWFNTAVGTLQVYNGTTFKTVGGATPSATAPTSNVAGDLWYDTVNAQLKVYSGSAFILVGPASTSGQGQSGPVVNTITDSFGNDHVVVYMYVGNSLVSIYSKDAAFTPAAAISGFSTINPGENMTTAIAGAEFWGTANNATYLGGLPASSYVVNTGNANANVSGTFSVLNNGGMYFGANSQAHMYISGSDTIIENTVSNGDIILRANVAGTPQNVVTIDGATGNVTFTGGITSGIVSTSGIVNTNGNGIGSIGSPGAYFGTAYVASVNTGAVTASSIINANANGTGNIGSAGGYFDTIFAKATSAQYADLAERYTSDAEYAPGTVVELGGSAEVTLVKADLSEAVLGVVSTNPAHVMNDGLQGTAVTVALVGRVPVTVVGQVKKGDRLVSAGNGVARAAQGGEANAFNVIGRSLEDKLTDEQGTIEAIVTVK